MSEPRFLTVDETIVIHQLMIATHGGAQGVRDVGMLDSAVQRAQNRWAYEGAAIHRLASDYAFGIAKNHPFIDGNKRTAFMAAYTFLGLNGMDFVASEAEVVITILALAAGELDEDELAAWFEAQSKPKS